MKIIKYSFIVILITFFVLSCHKIVILPIEPHIKFTSFAVFDTTDILGNNIKGGRLKFYFEDGDGDVGISSNGQADTADLFFTLYRKSNGIFSEVPDDDLMKPSAYRIPYLTREGQNKILKGTISVTFYYLFYVPSENDTVKYRFFIKDRAQHYSDTVYTSEIPLSFNNIYMK